MMKRILSLILALMLTLSCLPLDTRAFGAELEPEPVSGEEAEPVSGEEAEPDEDAEWEEAVQEADEDTEWEEAVQEPEPAPDDGADPAQVCGEEAVTEAVQYNGPDGENGDDDAPSEPQEPPQAHEHDYTAGWVYFQRSTDPEAAGYVNSGDITWNPEVSHGRAAKCACGETNHAFNIWMEPHSLDENGRCTKCNWERQYTVLVRYTVPAPYAAPASQEAAGVPGAEYSIQSPQVEGLLPSRETVSGTFTEGDETITVAYTEVSSTVTVNYTVPEGFNAPDPKSVTNTYHSDYSIPSPVLEGLTADRGEVSGQIQAQDETFTVNYTENDHTLTVVYKVPDGTAAPEPATVRGKHGGKYDIKSPTLPGLTPDRVEVIGEMGITDETVTVTYSPTPRTVLVQYQVPEGFTTPGSQSKTGEPGTDYRFLSPAIDGLTPDQGEVKGKIQGTDETFTVTYTPNEYTVTVEYKVPLGFDAPDPKSIKGIPGTACSFPSPAISGLTPDQAAVSGEIGVEDQTITVTYTRPVYTVAVEYKVPSGYRTPKAVARTGAPGTAYQFVSPAVEGLEPNRDQVAGQIGQSDETITVTYQKVRYYSVTVHLVDSYDSLSPPIVKEHLRSGEEYSIPCPQLACRIPDREVVSGTIEDSDVEVTVTYRDGANAQDLDWGPEGAGCAHSRIRCINPRAEGPRTHSIEYECRDHGGSKIVHNVPCEDYLGGGYPAKLTPDGYCDWCAQFIGTPATVTVNYVVPEGFQAPEPQSKTGQPGTEYSFWTPAVDGLVPDREKVEGSIGSESETITVTYAAVHNLTIHYVFPQGYPRGLAFDETLLYRSGESYSITPPACDNLDCFPQTVTGTMGNADQEVTVTYDYNTTAALSYWLTVNYTVPEGFKAPEQVKQRVESGSRYYVESPSIDRLAPQRRYVSGTMPNQDVNVTVDYYQTNIHRLTVNYTVPAGYEAQQPPTFTGDYWENQEYAVITPKIAGLEAMQSAVGGRMGNHDITETVEYRLQNTTPIQEYKVWIMYVMPEGSGIQGRMIYEWKQDGAPYEYISPTVPGYKPDRNVIKGHIMGADVYATVNYKKSYTLTVNFAYPEDYTGEKTPAWTIELWEGEDYLYPTPSIAGMTATPTGCAVHENAIRGKMGTTDLTATVTFAWSMSDLTVNFTFPEGYTGERPASQTLRCRCTTPYEYDPPQLEQLTPKPGKVTGTMGYGGRTVTVNYEWATRNLNVNFIFPATYTGAKREPFSRPVQVNHTYRYLVDDYNDMKPDLREIEGVMGDQDVTIDVYYRYTHTLRVQFLYPEGYTGSRLPEHTQKVAQGDWYEYRPQEVPGMPANPSVVNGTMGEEDVTINVLYGDSRTLKVSFQFPDGYRGKQTAPYTEAVFVGGHYDYAAPQLPGLSASPDHISGEMGSEDVEQTIVYAISCTHEGFEREYHNLDAMLHQVICTNCHCPVGTEGHHFSEKMTEIKWKCRCGEITYNIKAFDTDEEDTAAVPELTEEDLKQLEHYPFEIDASTDQEDRENSAVSLSTDSVEKLGGSNASGVKIKLDTGTAKLDRQALGAVAEQAAGQEVKVQVKTGEQAQGAMNARQQEAVRGMDKAQVIDINITSGGENIHDLGGGHIDLTVPVGTSEALLGWCIDANGGKESVPCVNNGNGTATITPPHCSIFVLERVPAEDKPISVAGAVVTVANQTYTGKALTPAVTVKLNGKTLRKGTDYAVAWSNHTNAGKATVKVTGKGRYTGTVTGSFTIKKANQTVTVTGKTSMYVGTAQTLKASGKGALSYASGNTKIATVNAKGVVTAKAAGTVRITVTAAGDRNHNKASKTLTIAVKKFATPKVTKAENVAGGVKLTLKRTAGAARHRIFYKTGKGGWTKLADTNADTYLWKGAKNGTRYTFTVRCITADGKIYTSDFNSTGMTVTYVASPALSGVKNTRAGTATAAWNKLAGVTGFQVQYSTDKTFRSGVRTVTVKKAAAVSQVITGLSKGRTYYFRIRSYKTVSGKPVYSGWSAAKGLKITK